MSKVYCTAPWNGITVRENGDVKTCCQGGISLGNLNTSPIQEILKSNKLSNIQATMITGNPHLQNCSVCINQEKTSGLSSLRQHYIAYYPDVYQDTKLKNLDIRWNNSCNLGCMYCSPMFSSTWQDRIGRKPASPVKTYQDDLLEFILENVNELNEILLVGGEPMLMKQNYKLINALPKITKVSVITNLSYDLESLPCIDNLLNRPKNNTIWSVSLENTGQQFEYVRNGASWNQVEKNLEFLIKHWPDTVSVLMVYSMFNAFEIHSVIKKLHELGVKKFTLQSYSGPHAMNVFCMPEPIQQQARDTLIQAQNFHYGQIHQDDFDLYAINNLEPLLDKLNDYNQVQCPVSKQNFYKQIEWYDRWNNNRFCDLWPNVIDLVDQYLL